MIVYESIYFFIDFKEGQLKYHLSSGAVIKILKLFCLVTGLATATAYFKRSSLSKKASIPAQISTYASFALYPKFIMF